MTILIGFVLILGMVFGGYMLSGGEMDIILHALPFEGMMIGGAAAGSFIAANSFANIRGAGKGLLKTMKGPKWKPADYIDLLNLMYTLAQMYRQNGMLSLMNTLRIRVKVRYFRNTPSCKRTTSQLI